MMPNHIQQYLPYLQHRLTRARLDHSLAVMRGLTELAGVYQLDPRQAELAGLLHDIAKDESPSQLVMLAEAMGIAFAEPCERHPVYLHAVVGARLARTACGMTDPAVLHAIAAHSYAVPAGPEEESTLAWCLRFADILAPVRAWPGMRKLRRIVYQGQMPRAALLLTGWLLEYLNTEHLPVHPQLRDTYAALASQLIVDDTFFDREE